MRIQMTFHCLPERGIIVNNRRARVLQYTFLQKRAASLPLLHGCGGIWPLKDNNKVMPDKTKLPSLETRLQVST